MTFHIYWCSECQALAPSRFDMDGKHHMVEGPPPPTVKRIEANGTLTRHVPSKAPALVPCGVWQLIENHSDTELLIGDRNI